MLDVVYVGLTVAFFVALAVLARAVERLGGPEPAAGSERPTTDLAVPEAGR